MKGQLYIVATPIGNLDDITLRAIKTLNYVDIIAVEDTRHSKKLLNHLGISKPLISYWREKEKVRAKAILDKLKDGFSVALISDAGTPGISDPGGILVRHAVAEGLNVISVPGPSSLTASLSIAGIPTERFFFYGFLSAKPNQRKKELAELKFENKTLVFFESPHRLMDFLFDLSEILGNRQIALCHELTKYHEEVLRGSVQEVIEKLEEGKIAGEYVVIVDKAEEGSITLQKGVTEVMMLIEEGLPRKEAASIVSKATGLNRNLLYKQSMLLEEETQDV